MTDDKARFVVRVNGRDGGVTLARCHLTRCQSRTELKRMVQAVVQRADDDRVAVCSQDLDREWAFLARPRLLAQLQRDGQDFDAQ